MRSVRGNWNRVLPGVMLAIALAGAGTASAVMDLDTAASYFGKRSGVWGMRMSPDGSKMSFLRNHPEDFPIAMVIDLETGKANPVLASDPKKGMYVEPCQWATNSRLLCGYYGVWNFRGNPVASTRLVAVDADGGKPKVLAQRQQRENWAFHQDEIVALLPDDPKYIWLEFDEGRGEGVVRVDIEKNKLKTIVKPRETVWGYHADSRREEVRIRYNSNRTNLDLEYRLAGDRKWRKLHRYEADDLTDDYELAAFTSEPNEILVWDDVDGRRALLRETLGEDASAPRERSVVFAHPEVDVAGLASLGKYGRVVAVSYETDRRHLHYFDEVAKQVHERVAEEFGDVDVVLVDESWDRRYYLFLAHSDVNPGAYYRYDTKADQIARITNVRSWLEEDDLSPMEAVRFPSRDGKQIPGYLTTPTGTSGKNLPLIVYPHGGPWARDSWGFDWVPQFLAAQGYAVLQPNYRGSTGYGDGWVGEGALKEWKVVMQDIEDAVRHLVEKGVADPTRVCTVGWSFGGYAALMSPLENPGRYRCAVSIAGLTDPYRLYEDAPPVRKKAFRKLVATKGDDVQRNSPLRRAEEMPVPVLLFHGDLDLNVPVDHGQDLAKALRRAEKTVEYVEYENADHFLERERQRIDMLQRIADFLDQHLKKKADGAS